MKWTALTVFVVLFGFITIMGFFAARWRRGDLDLLHEWGLAGRRLGTVITWFLLGGDLYTAYTFIAVPALVFGVGAIGFFALPYTIIVYPLVFLILPRLWSVAHRHHYITAADFVAGRYGNRWLALAVAVTGIVATMPYIALQLVGLQVVIGAMGVGTAGASGDLPLIIAFVILAAFTYTSGLRAPAMIAVVKDTLIYVTVLAMVIVIPIELGGYAKMFSMVPAEKLILAPPRGGNLGQYSAYATLALGSAFALFLYPHSLTGVLSASGRNVIRRNAAYLTAYSFMLGLLALTVIRQTLQRPVRHVIFLAGLMALVTAFGWALGLGIGSVVPWSGLPRFVAECLLWLVVMALAAAPLRSGRLRDSLSDLIPS